MPGSAKPPKAAVSLRLPIRASTASQRRVGGEWLHVAFRASGLVAIATKHLAAEQRNGHSSGPAAPFIGDWIGYLPFRASPDWWAGGPAERVTEGLAKQGLQ